jgi:hypothetical protein
LTVLKFYVFKQRIFMKTYVLFTLLFGISMTCLAQPANDDPCAAISIPVTGPDYLGLPCVPTTTFSWNNATLTTATPNPSCAAGTSSNIRDVWYTMIVPPSGKIKVSFNAATTLILVFYRPANCSNTLNFTEAGCFNYTSLNATQTTELSALTPNTTIYLRVMRTIASIMPSGSMKLCALESITPVAINNATRIGIGTTSPLAKLDVVGKAIVRDSMSIGKSLEVRENLSISNNLEINGNLKTNAIQLTQNAGAGKVLKSDASGNGSWSVADSVYSSAWVVSPYNSRDTVIDGTCHKLRHIDAPQITSYILNNKLITVYFRIGSIGPYQLPYVSEAGGATNQINCVFQVGKILVYRYTYSTCRFHSGIPESYPGQPVMINLPSSIEYRYVIHN